MGVFKWETGDRLFILRDLLAHGYGRTDISALFAFVMPNACNLPSPAAVDRMLRSRGYRLAPDPKGPVPEWLAARLFSSSIEERRYIPGMRRDAVQRAVVAASLQFGLPIPLIVGARAIRSPRAVAARQHIIAALYDPATAGRYNHGFAYGISEVGRVLGLDHATVRKHCTEIEARAGA